MIIGNPITLGGGGGGGGNLGTKNITANGTYEAADDNLDGYDKAIVAVPNTYTASDEGKVVSGGGLVTQTSRSVTANGTYDTTTNGTVNVHVTPVLVSKNIYANGDYDPADDNADGFSSLFVDVPETDTEFFTIANFLKNGHEYLTIGFRKVDGTTVVEEYTDPSSPVTVSGTLINVTYSSYGNLQVCGSGQVTLSLSMGESIPTTYDLDGDCVGIIGGGNQTWVGKATPPGGGSSSGGRCPRSEPEALYEMDDLYNSFTFTVTVTDGT